MEHESLTGIIIGCAMKVHTVLGPGYLESVYHRALAYELRRSGLNVESEKELTVYYDGVEVGSFFPDLFVENTIIVEIKARQTFASIDEVQTVNYLTATHVEIGLLLNFGAEKLGIKRKTRTYRPRSTGKLI